MRTLYFLVFIASFSTAQTAFADLSAIWAQDGLDKVTQEELRGEGQRNAVWDGSKISIFSAQNETVSFALVLESAQSETKNISVRFAELKDSNGHSIRTRTSPVLSKSKGELFDFTDRPIEAFYVRYLQVRGTSNLFYDTYDERHVPRSLRRSHDEQGVGKGTWNDRPKHDQSFPDILVPLELHPKFDIASGKSQMIWFDVTLAKNAVPGIYRGQVEIQAGSNAKPKAIAVELEVEPFSLPDEPTLKTMLYLGYPDVALRYTGTAWPLPGSTEERVTELVRDRHFQVAHRHKISMIDANMSGASVNATHPLPAWKARLTGSLFTKANGYAGPGAGVGNGVFSIGTYGQWSWKDSDEATMHSKLNEWASWFKENSPKTELFLYLIDESEHFEKIEKWSKWIKSNPGPGKSIRSFATFPLVGAIEKIPSLDIAATWFTVGDTSAWNAAVSRARELKKPLYFYNGKRPGTPSFATEDDGIALRALAWTQYAHQIDRWFYWESTYYNDYQAGLGQTNVFRSARTYGKGDLKDDVKGESGWNHSNGDGVLFYPGTDRVFKDESYEALGPFASLRMKAWRRGLQDADYLALASKKNPARVKELLSKFVPRTLWQNGVSDSKDPTWVRCPMGWVEDNRPWEDARRELASIIADRPIVTQAAPSPIAEASKVQFFGGPPAPKPPLFERAKNFIKRIIQQF